MSEATKGVCGQRYNIPGNVLLDGSALPGKPKGIFLRGDLGVGNSLLLLSQSTAHLTLPGRQKEKTVLGWRRSQSLSQQQFKSQVPGVKSQTQIDKAISERGKAR